MPHKENDGWAWAFERGLAAEPVFQQVVGPALGLPAEVRTTGHFKASSYTTMFDVRFSGYF